MTLLRLESYLQHSHVAVQVMEHAAAFKAEEIAANAHVSSIDFAKTLLLSLDGEDVMLVLPACYELDVSALAKAQEVKKVRFWSEQKMAEKFPDCEVGAAPPFGVLYGLPVLIARELTLREHIYFNAGNHHQVMKMDYLDFHDLVTPTTISQGYVRRNPARHIHVHHAHFSH